MNQFETKIFSPNQAGVRAAAEELLRGNVVGIPTETVYGLAANIRDEAAVYRIFETKHRPADNPLIVHISAFEQIFSVARVVYPLAKTLAEKFWPGPLTMVLPKDRSLSDAVTAGQDTVGIRMPAHPVARAIIDAAGVPLAAPSANLSGIPSPTCAEHVFDDLNGSIPCIVDGGECTVGVESTVIRVEEDRLTLLRPGGITVEQLKTVCENVTVAPGVLEHLDENAKVESPGMKYRHYSPKVPVIILDGGYEAFVSYVTRMQRQHLVGAMVFSGEGERLSCPVVTYGSKGNGASEAMGLFSALRKLDSLKVEVVYARMPAKDGVGFAVYNRLLRAAGFHVVDLREQNRSFVLGLTGKTGAGKGKVCAILKDRGFYAVDCDQTARKAVEKGSETLCRLVKAFGKGILTEAGECDRKALGRIVFSDKEKLAQLNAITHPAILKLIEDEIDYASGRGYVGICLDAPTLFESGADALCDKTVFVTADFKLRKNRILQRDALTEGEALQRMNAQKPDEFYAKRADVVFANNGEEALLAAQADQMLCALMGSEGK